MKTFSKLDRSLSQVTKWAKGNQIWVEWHQGEKDYINKYIVSGEESTGSIMMIGRLSFADISNSLLYIKDSSTVEAISLMKIGVNRRLHSFLLDLMLARKYMRSSVIDLDSINRIIFLALTVGLPNLAQKFYRFIYAELSTGATITNGHTNFMDESLRYSAMAMTIFNDWLNLPPPDLDKLALPKDPVWMKYANNWREENVELFAEILNEACDVHIERIGLTQKEYDSGEYEFASPFEAVYPVEILGVLRLRERLGLQNPELTHPLLLTPYAQITSHSVDHMSIEDPLLDDYLSALRKYNPELIEAWDKFQM